MFKRGGGVSSRNNGIVQGFDNGGSVLEDLRAAGLLTDAQKPQGLSTSDYLRIAAAGAQIMGAQPTGRSGVIGALQAASPALSGLGVDLAESSAQKNLTYQNQLQAQKDLMASGIVADREAALQRELATLDKDEFERVLDKADELREIISDPNKTAKEKADAYSNYTVLMLREIGVDLEDYALSTIRQDNPDLSDEDFGFEVLKLRLPELAGELSVLKEQVKMAQRQGTAEGGRVGLNTGGNADAEEISSAEEAAILAQQKQMSQKQNALMQLIESQRSMGVKNSNRVIEEIERKGSVLSPSDKNFIMERNNALNSYNAMMRDKTGQMGRGDVPGYYNQGGLTSADRADVREQSSVMQNQTELSFEELRARLPREVTDQVVRLLATSEAALLDFANIDTEQDIAIFNQKYNSDLQLPTQVA